MANTQSTVTLQSIVDDAQRFGDIAPVMNVGGSSSEPALTIANDVMNAICGLPFPHKWNEFNITPFYTNSWQQDYATNTTTLSWLERGIVIDINSTATQKAFRNVEVGRQLSQATGNWAASLDGNPLFLVNFFPNKTLYYGTWGAANVGTSGSFGNNPVAGSVYKQSLGSTSMLANPINQIKDANGNLLQLTGYGTEGTTAPLAPANSLAGVTATPGVGATTVWKVIDPNGQGFRILNVPSQTGTLWQFNLTGQAKPIRFASLGQTLDPLPDEFESNFREGFIARCYRYSPEAKIRAKFKDEWTMWLQSLLELRSKEDREPEEQRFIPERNIMGGWSGRCGQKYPLNLIPGQV